MGPQQLAGVMSIVARQSALSQGKPFDEDADAAMRQQIEDQIERESYALFMTGKLYDDGIIDPRDTRTVLGMCLSAIDNGEIHGTPRLRRGSGCERRAGSPRRQPTIIERVLGGRTASRSRRRSCAQWRGSASRRRGAPRRRPRRATRRARPDPGSG
jgi:hypothetical protein